jgi:hypothetical protein
LPGVAVEIVGLDVVGDDGGKEIGAGVAGFEAVAKAGGGDVFVDGLEEVDAGLLEGRQAHGVEIAERRAGAADDDPLGEFEEAIVFVPVGKVEKAVGSGEVEELCVGQELMEGGESLNGVVGGAVGVGGVELGDGEAGVGDAGEAEHGEAIAIGGGCAVGFEGLETYGGEEDGVELEGIGGGGGDTEVAAVRRVEGAAEEGYSHRRFSPDGESRLNVQLARIVAQRNPF